MAEVASAFVSLLPSARGFGSKLDSQIGGEVDASGKRAGSRFGGALKVGALAVLGGAAVLGGFLKGLLDEAREAQKVGALTNQVIKTTGGVANVTAKQVGALATSISLKSGVDDEAIQSAENLLLTFKNVRNEAGEGNKVFDRATQAATDLSAAGFGDLNGASKQLGKALNDPIKGITALSRSGVTFTDQQKQQIKTLVGSGKTLQAQKIILGEVESQVGGAAAASATFGEKAKVAFSNIQEQVGTALLPVVDALFRLFLRSVPTITRLIAGIGPAFVRVGAFVAPAVTAVKRFFASLSGGGGAAGGLLATLRGIGSAIVTNFLPVLKTAATTFTTVVLPAVVALGKYLAANLLPVFRQAGDIVAHRVVPIVASLARFFYGTLYPAVVKIVTAIASRLKPVFDQLVKTFRSSVLPSIQLLLVKLRQWQPTIQKVVVIVVKVIGFLLKLAAAILGKVLPVVIRLAGFLLRNTVRAVVAVISIVAKVIGKIIGLGKTVVGAVKSFAQFVTGARGHMSSLVGFVKGVPGKVLAALGSLGAKLLSFAKKAFGQLRSGAGTAALEVIRFLRDLPQKILGGLGDLGSVLVHAGGALIQGLLDGITAKLSALVAKMKEVASKVKGFLPGSPVREGPLRSWNRGGAGKRLVNLLAEGLSDTSAVDAAMARLTSRMEVRAPLLAAPVSGVRVARGGDGAGLRPIHVTMPATMSPEAAAAAAGQRIASALSAVGI